ncbi:cation transporter [Falsirhodobacter sp. alg1]|uniref:cation transporter n=1 Tax=Falsirhodobacter sp. alg1 TaxID=1472418 RepID=UPI000787FA52|nr:cation transporter [Falsirhodobacter sp. alg1]
MPCCSSDSCASSAGTSGRFRRVLWIALVINGGMFVAEIAAGLLSGSAALQADALDFLADASNYAISLFVLGMTLRWRAGAAWIKGASMGLFGLWVLATVVWHIAHGSVPDAPTMGMIGTLALVMNLICLLLLMAFRDGDANMRSVWICSRNDVIANVAVLLAALGVFGTGTGWPDFIVASLMAGLALQGAATILRDATCEWRSAEDTAAVPILR